MKRKLIIDGNAVYELDEECMLQKKMDKERIKTEGQHENKNKEEYREEH
ncbi:hypothetical protein H8S37_06620 [Mediterraneibacter sp. NSJ-55]|uniref:Uncharacterized protein n=1 Tax=Mediterraneibacter hominis TaxID=2763054 RepID=A0A923LI84_9FIRM|nr:hypothetical protein [Mediterraneibacter hominis]MBC5688602.1 hypothetical protein [Mediterraneibacter hominis]